MSKNFIHNLRKTKNPLSLAVKYINLFFFNLRINMFKHYNKQNVYIKYSCKHFIGLGRDLTTLPKSL